MKRNIHRGSSRGFTLIELLVVISIVSVLSSVILVSLQAAREKGRIGGGIKFATYNYHKFGATQTLASWPLDEAAGMSSARDISGNNYVLTLNCSPNCSAPEPPAQFFKDSPNGSSNSLLLNGSNGKAEAVLPTEISLFGQTRSQGFTVSIWVKYNGPASPGVELDPIVSMYDNSDRMTYVEEYYYVSEPDAFLALVSSADGQTKIPQISPWTLQVGKWQQVTIAFDKTSTKLYLDGHYLGEANPDLGNAGLPVDVSGDLVDVRVKKIELGYKSSPTAYFHGYLSNLAIYNETLTAYQIEQLYAEEAGRFLARH